MASGTPASALIVTSVQPARVMHVAQLPCWPLSSVHRENAPVQLVVQLGNQEHYAHLSISDTHRVGAFVHTPLNIVLDSTPTGLKPFGIVHDDEIIAFLPQD